MHHAFVIEAEVEAGVELALAWIEEMLGLSSRGPSTELRGSNPDVIVLRHGLFSVDDARRVVTLASQSPTVGDAKAIVIAATRAYHESQNALLKLFEEPPRGTYLFLILPTLGSLLPTLRSRVHILDKHQVPNKKSHASPEAEEFLKASIEKRTALIKKLATGRDEDERREHRDRAIAIVNGVEAAAAHASVEKHIALLRDIQELRAHLYDRSAPVKMILEHLSLILPKGLL